jgi:nucleoside-diphosphate-sugar epimerase
MVTGGAGYVGSKLVPTLLDNGHAVNVLDLYLYGKDIFGTYHDHPQLTEIRGDIRDPHCVEKAMKDCDAVIHLACISNDPSFDLDPKLGKSINLDSFHPMVKIAKALKIKRFIYASSSSVYGIKEEPNVTEELSLEPLTDYSKYKAECEEIFKNEASSDFETVIIRPSTVCGYATRLRLDLTVNILTTHAYFNKKIKVFGGKQLRPNIHIQDMCDAYLCLLAADKKKIDGKTFNVGYQNLSVQEIADMVKETFSENIEIEIQPTNDNRSYHVSSEKVKKELGFTPKYTVQDAICDLKCAFEQGLVKNPFDNPIYYNIKQMQEVGLT